MAHTKFTGGTDAAWNALELTAAGMQLPPALSSAMAATKKAYFEPEYLALRDRLLTALIAGEKPELTANQWSPITVGRLSAAVNVAEAALDAAKDHTAQQYSAALRSLIVQLVLLVGALVLTFGALMLVTRRVIKPLHNMRDAMLKVAAGDLPVDTGYAQRARTKSARWPARWKRSSSRPRTRSGSRRRSANAMPAPPRASRRSKAMSANSRTMVRQTLDQLGDASGQMRTTSDGLSAVSRQTNARVQVAEKASSEASMSVETVAAASEELSASINDISQQAAHAAGIASRAVSQARETDGTVQGLAEIRRPDRRSRRPDQLHRRPDQPAGAERHHRGRARR